MRACVLACVRGCVGAWVRVCACLKRLCLTCPRRLLLLLMREKCGDLRAELLVAGEERLERGDRLADPAEHELVEQRLPRVRDGDERVDERHRVDRRLRLALLKKRKKRINF